MPLHSRDKANDWLTQGIIGTLNDYIMPFARRQIQLAFQQAQKEIEDIHQRTREGIETARRNGKKIGQVRGRQLLIKKKGPVQQLILKHSRTFGGLNSDREVIVIINASSFITDGQAKPIRLHVRNNTYYKYKAELRYS